MLDLTDWQNKKYQTRDGKPVRLLCIDAMGEQPIVGQTLARQTVLQWSLAGSFSLPFVSTESDFDLINTKVKKEGWVNVYPLEKVVFYRSKVAADNYAATERIACVKIEWEE